MNLEKSNNTNIDKTILHDPIIMKKLCDRVYQLWCEDIGLHQERTQGYRRKI
ncbi:MAG: hypothetical protein ACFB02_09595 [Mastigocoleus sp.]